jgi:hypothetical protein
VRSSMAASAVSPSAAAARSCASDTGLLSRASKATSTAVQRGAARVEAAS